jgi:hypothetical protein
MNLLGFMLPGWAKWAALAVLALSIYVFGRSDGKAIAAKELSAAKIRLQTAQAQVVTETEIVYRDRIKIIKEKGDVIVKEIPIYITAETDRNFPVSNGFVRVHDSAASGEPAGPAEQSDGKAATVTASQSAETVAVNYAECRKLAEQVTGWQEFYLNLQNTAIHP